MKAYIGKLTTDRGTLVGGVKKHLSAAFESEIDAQSWVDTVVKINKEANRCIESATVIQIQTYGPVISASNHDWSKAY